MELEVLPIVWAINHNQHYLFGRPFTVVMDHHSLCHLCKMKDPCNWIARWIMKLHEYDWTSLQNWKDPTEA